MLCDEQQDLLVTDLLPPSENVDLLRSARCNRCGSDKPHSKEEKCPAFGKACNYCKVTGHFRSVCFKLKRKQEWGEGKINAVDNAPTPVSSQSDTSDDDYSYDGR